MTEADIPHHREREEESGQMSDDLGTKLQGEFDAAVWTDAWLATIAEHPDIPTDSGTMVGWFANAIMAGYDHARRERPPKLGEVSR